MRDVIWSLGFDFYIIVAIEGVQEANMKIVVLDDVSMSSEQKKFLHSLGEVHIYEGIPQSNDELLRRAEGAEVLILGWTKITEETMRLLKSLKLISVWATGYDYVDVTAATKLGITVTNVPDYAKASVAELTIGLILSLLRHIPNADKDVKKGNYDWKPFKGNQLFGKTLGLIGIGAIGSEVARLGKSLGMNIICYTRNPSKERADKLELEFVDLVDLLKESDVVSLHIPLNESTKNLIGKEQFDLMKDYSVLINTSRAELIDQTALYNALKEKKIKGAALDVIDTQSETFKDMLELNNIILTPHIGFNTQEASVIKTDICLNNVKSFISGNPVNAVNKK